MPALLPAWRKPASAAACILALSLLAGCGPRVTNANLERVQLDMSKKQVESIMGRPTKVETDQPHPRVTTTRYYYLQDRDEVLLVFTNDKLVTKSGKFSK